MWVSYGEFAFGYCFVFYNVLIGLKGWCFFSVYHPNSLFSTLRCCRYFRLSSSNNKCIYIWLILNSFLLLLVAAFGFIIWFNILFETISGNGNHHQEWPIQWISLSLCVCLCQLKFLCQLKSHNTTQIIRSDANLLENFYFFKIPIDEYGDYD